VANYPYDGSLDRRTHYAACPDDATFVFLARTYAAHHASMHNSTEFKDGITNGAQWYPVYGGMQVLTQPYRLVPSSFTRTLYTLVMAPGDTLSMAACRCSAIPRAPLLIQLQVVHNSNGARGYPVYGGMQVLSHTQCSSPHSVTGCTQ
jgi:Zinc carboxypeptidase